MTDRFTYPVDLTDNGIGGLIAKVPDLPGTMTEGEDKAEALAEAADALATMLATLIRHKEDIPRPSPAKGRDTVQPPAQMAVKAALYLSARESGLGNADLARLLEMDPKDVRRLLNHRHNSTLDSMERAIKALGHKLMVSLG